jgi:hypothetical protein
MRENAFIVASLLTRSRDPSLFLRHPSVYSCCLATTVRFGSSLLGTARRKHRVLYYCVIEGACFDVTVLTWRKYATILYWKYCQLLFNIDFSLLHSVKIVGGLSRPLVQWTSGVISIGVKQSGREASHSPPSGAEAKNVGAISTLPHKISWRGA